MRTRNKILLGFGIAIGALILAAGITLYVISRDEPPPDDSDLIVKRLDIPDDQNGFTYFQQAGAALYWPGTEAWKKSGKHQEPEDLYSAPENDPQVKAAIAIRDRLDKMLAGKDWDEALAKEILEANKPTFALIEKGLACRECQAPEAKGIETAFPKVSGLLILARLMKLRVFDLARRGQDEAALNQAGDLVQLGHGIAGSRGALIVHLVGITCKSKGLSAVVRLLPGTHAAPDQLGALSRRLASMADTREQLAETFRAEYNWAWGVVEDFHSGRAAPDEFQMGRWAAYMDYGFVFKPNETKHLYADHFRALIAKARRPGSEVELPGPPWPKDSGTVRKFLSGNVVGRVFYAMFTPTMRLVLDQGSRIMTETGAVETMVALKAFKMKTGRLPKMLDELVPEYLAAVPLDDFDGKPMRYSPEKKILYSVGKDLKDVGGFTREESLKWWQKEYPYRPPEDAPLEPPVWDLPNPSWPIEF